MVLLLREFPLTSIESLQLIICLLCILHAIQEWTNTRIIFTPEVVCDCVWLVIARAEKPVQNVQDKATAGTSAVAAGILPGYMLILVDFVKKRLGIAVNASSKLRTILITKVQYSR